MRCPNTVSLAPVFYIFVLYKIQFVFVYLLQSNLTHISRSEYVPGIGLGIAKCPYDPLDNSTAIYVENGNPGGLPALVSCSFVLIFFLFLLHVG